MHAALARNLYFVKEHHGFFKASNNYDILDPQTKGELLHCREPKMRVVTKILRFTDYKRLTPFRVVVTTPGGEPVLRVERGVSIFRSRVKVFDEHGTHVGGFRQKLISIGDKFDLLDTLDNPIGILKGGLVGFNFRFFQGEKRSRR